MGVKNANEHAWKKMKQKSTRINDKVKACMPQSTLIEEFR
jgi:hypothetical protein